MEPNEGLTFEWFGGSRGDLTDLFALADDSEAAVASYRDLGRVLVARDDDGTILGHLQLIDGERAGEVELKSLAVREDQQGRGIGSRLVRHAIANCRDQGDSTLLVSTAAADTRVLRFYQLAGFRMLRVERDAFTAENGYPPVDIDGIPLRDRLWLALDL